jgi:Asp-tRNA(Asn)/Glu-tRNA(Gln) amidotransferase A subunit family amidase
VSHPQDLSLRDQAAAVANGSLDAGELLDATLTRIAERDGALNSTPVTFPKDSHQMLADAPLGPLHGVPLTIKDMFALPWRGARNGTTMELFPPTASAPFRRLRDAGAVIAGVANMHELGMGSTGVVSAYGPMHNPWNLAMCAGGSSGGSAAAVAGGLIAGSLGSDSGGSTRLPAAYCGVLGLKVTYRALPYDGYFGMGTTFSAPGAFARDAADTRLLVEALLARPLPQADATGLRVGVVTAPFWSDCDPAVAAACSEAVDAAGWNVTEVAIDHLELAGPASMARLMAEAGSPTAALLDQVSAGTRALMLAAMLIPARVVPKADRVRAALIRALEETFSSIDLLAWPATAAPAPAIDDPWVELPSGRMPADISNIRQASLANLCGVPGISVPVGLHPSGLPIGLQLLAPWSNEGRLLDAASHLEEATGRAHVDRRPG